MAPPSWIASWLAPRKLKSQPSAERAFTESMTWSRLHSTLEFSMPSVTTATMTLSGRSSRLCASSCSLTWTMLRPMASSEHGAGEESGEP